MQCLLVPSSVRRPFEERASSLFNTLIENHLSRFQSIYSSLQAS